jgi:uncharacterized protein YkwD
MVGNDDDKRFISTNFNNYSSFVRSLRSTSSDVSVEQPLSVRKNSPTCKHGANCVSFVSFVFMSQIDHRSQQMADKPKQTRQKRQQTFAQTNKERTTAPLSAVRLLGSEANTICSGAHRKTPTSAGSDAIAV